MTDKDIKKALECCADKKWLCPQCKYIGRCKQVQRGALDLINRQERKIEELETALFHMGELEQGWIVTGYKNIKAEARKEFAERLKEKKYQAKDVIWHSLDYVVSEKTIDKVLEETE